MPTTSYVRKLFFRFFLSNVPSSQQHVQLVVMVMMVLIWCVWLRDTSFESEFSQNDSAKNKKVYRVHAALNKQNTNFSLRTWKTGDTVETANWGINAITLCVRTRRIHKINTNESDGRQKQPREQCRIPHSLSLYTVMIQVAPKNNDDSAEIFQKDASFIWLFVLSFFYLSNSQIKCLMLVLSIVINTLVAQQCF